MSNFRGVKSRRRKAERSLNVLSHIEFPISEVWKVESGRKKVEIPLNIPSHIEFLFFDFRSVEGRK